MITYLGEAVYPNGKNAPELYSIGVALGRIPRFCGHTRDFYPVLAHVQVVAAIMPVEYALAGLLHDAPEACVSDVPTPWKTQVARNREHMLLRRIYEKNELAWPLEEAVQEAVDTADHMALAAEAHVIGHPAAKEIWPEYDERTAQLTQIQLSQCRSYLEPEISGKRFEETFKMYREAYAPLSVRGTSTL